MARFFFDRREGDRILIDEEGIDFATTEEARAEAKLALTLVFRDAFPGAIERGIAIVVSDESRTPLFELALLFFEVPLRSDEKARQDPRMMAPA